MAINANIQTLINTNRKLSENDVNQMFLYYYGRQADSAEKSYWSKKTSQQLESALRPNASQFKTAGYYNDVVAPQNNINKPTIESISNINPFVNTTTPSSSSSTNQSENNKPTQTSNTSNVNNPTPSASTNQNVNTFQLPENLKEKFFQATNNISPTQQDILDYQYSPTLFEKKLDNLIATKNEEINAKNRESTINEVKDSVANGAQAVWDGKASLVKFIEDPDQGGPQNTSTVYYVDTDKKTLRPFLSKTAFNTAYSKNGLTLDDAISQGLIKTISLANLNKNQALSGFNRLGNEYGFKDDGKWVEEPNTSVMYGKERNKSAEKDAIKLINGVFDNIKDNPDFGISTDLLNTITINPTDIGFYANAITYGDYSISDVLKDLKRRQLVLNGDKSLENLKVINDSVTSDKYYATPEGLSAKSNNNLNLPEYFGEIKTSDLDNPVYNLPYNLFNILVPPTDLTAKSTQEEIEKVKAAYYDVMLQQLDAKNEKDKAVADQAYKMVVEEADKSLGFKLSDNSLEAWNQLNSLGQTMGDRGLSGTGISEEARNKYLSDVRRADQRSRESHLTSEEEQRKLYYLNSASPEEISSLSDEEKQKYGLIPSDEIKQWFSKENLRTLYPNLTDKELENYANSIIDPTSGTYRSVLYQNLAINKLDTEQKKKVYQTGTVERDPDTGEVIGGSGYLYEQALKEQQAYKPYEKAGLFVKPKTETSTTTSEYVAPTTDTTINQEVGVGTYKPTTTQPSTTQTTPINNNVGVGIYKPSTTQTSPVVKAEEYKPVVSTSTNTTPNTGVGYGYYKPSTSTVTEKKTDTGVGYGYYKPSIK